MPSTFTSNTGIEKIGDGEQAGLWGQTTNVNFDIVDRALNGVEPITLLSTSYTLTTAAGGLSEGQAAAVIFSGSLGSAGTITVSPNNAQKTYIISNQTNQDLTITQGSGGDVTVKSGTSTIVMCTGEGSTSAVIEAFPPGETANLPDTLVQRDGDGNFAAGTITATLTGNVTGNASTANAWAVPRTLTIGSTGKTVDGSGNVSWTIGEIGAASLIHIHSTADVTSGVFAPERLASGVADSSRFLRGDSTWAELPDTGVLGVTASSPLFSSGGSTPNISLTGTVPINRGGTNATTSTTARTNLGLGTIATQNSTNVSITGGSVSATLSGNGSGVTNLNTTQVATAYSSVLPGDRGTYVLARVSGTVGFSVGSAAAGSSLTPSNTVGTASGSLSGSWEACGHVPAVSTTSERTTLWLRIS